MSQQEDWSECFYCDRPLRDMEEMRIVEKGPKCKEITLCLRCYEYEKHVVIIESGEEVQEEKTMKNKRGVET